MNKEEARQVVLEELKKYEKIPYEQLRDFVLQGKINAYQVIRGDTTYDIEILFHWDSRHEKRDIRVAGLINVSGDLSVYRPLSEDFILRPDGSFIE